VDRNVIWATTTTRA
jgi:hypothetical protein